MTAGSRESRAGDRPPASYMGESIPVPDSASRAEALAIVARQLHRPLLRFFCKRTGSLEEAKDIVQEAYVRVLAVARGEAIHDLDRYLWRCALNIMIDRRRNVRNRDRLVQALSTKPEQFAPSAEITADARERLALIAEAVHKLPPKCQQAFLLRVVRSLPFEEVGHEMKISSRMAKIYVARTLEEFRRQLNQPVPERLKTDHTMSTKLSRIRVPSLSTGQVRGREVRDCAAGDVFNSSDRRRPTDCIARAKVVAPRLSTTLGNVLPSAYGESLVKNAAAASVLHALIEGHEPGSEVPLPSDCVIHRADVMRALLTAVTALDRAEARAQRRALLPDNVGKAWTGEEDNRLAEAFKAGQSPQEIARTHRRTLRAVEARLQRMGLITESERTTRGGFPTPE